MKLFTFRWLFVGAMLFGAHSLQAQPSARTSRPDPNDPSVEVIVEPYRSSFNDYRSLRNEPVLPWKESNELVGRIGGWRVYAREATSNETPAAKPVPTTPVPTTPPKVQSKPPASSDTGNPGMQHGSHK